MTLRKMDLSFFLCLVADYLLFLEKATVPGNLLLLTNQDSNSYYSNPEILLFLFYYQLKSSDLPNLFNYTFETIRHGPGDMGSIPGRVIPKTQKIVLDASLLNTQHYKVRIKGKVEQSREGVAPSPTPWCSSYRKGSLRVTLD